MRSLAIIPARGGSKRIPRKNIKKFLGKPILNYSIETALDSGLFTEVMVSTEDEEIAKIAARAGAQIPFFRSPQNADDYATTADVLLEVVEKYKQLQQEFDYICCIYPTAPFVNPELLTKAYQKLLKEQLDAVFPVLRFSYPIQRGLKISDGKVSMLRPENLTTRSQDLEMAYHDAGQFYWVQTQVLKQEKKLFTNNTGAILLDEMEAHDIDHESDWKIAEFKYVLANEKKLIPQGRR